MDCSLPFHLANLVAKSIIPKHIWMLIEVFAKREKSGRVKLEIFNKERTIEKGVEN